MSNGILIAVEGIDGAGKTTQVELLRQFLQQHEQACVSSKEPTDGQWGRMIRATAATGRLPLDEELSLFIRDRKEHIETLIAPSLAAGKIVILDRYFYSTIAYQGSRGARWQDVENLMTFAPVPDVTLILDADPDVTLGRITSHRGEQPNEFEKHESLQACRNVFNALAHRPEVHMIDATKSQYDVQRQIMDVLLKGVLRSKRCGKSYGCDGDYCSLRQANVCQWANLSEAAAEI